MSSVRCGYGWQEIEIGPWSPATGARDWLPLEIRTVDEARLLLAGYQPFVHSLRSLLALDAGVEVARLSDQQVLERLAMRLARRELVVALKGRLEPSVGTPPASKAEAPAPSARTVTPSALRAGGGSAPPAPAPAPAPAPEEEAFDHDAQAETLRQAAADGVPFCEVCERLKAERAASVAEAA